MERREIYMRGRPATIFIVQMNPYRMVKIFIKRTTSGTVKQSVHSIKPPPLNAPSDIIQ